MCGYGSGYDFVPVNPNLAEQAEDRDHRMR